MRYHVSQSRSQTTTRSLHPLRIRFRTHVCRRRRLLVAVTGQDKKTGANQGNASMNSRNDKANAFFSIVVLLHGTFVLLILKQEIPIRLVSHLRDAYGHNREASKTEKNTFLYIFPRSNECPLILLIRVLYSWRKW